MGLIQDFLTQKPASSIFHYSGAGPAISIITHKRIWASKIGHLNDSAEHTHAAKWITAELDRRDRKPGAIARALTNAGLYGTDPGTSGIYETPLTSAETILDSSKPGRTWLRLAQTKKVVYVASFSEKGDSLSQWRAYCANGNGYSLGFDASKFEGAPAKGTSLVKCVYRDEEKRKLIAALVEDCEARDDGSDGSGWAMILDILVVMASMKHVSFEDECEWRLVSFGGGLTPSYRSGRHGIVPYVEIPFSEVGQLTLSEVCIGPNSDADAALESTRSLVSIHVDKTKSVNFTLSNTPYRQ